MEKRFSQACENNKSPILEHLKVYFSACNKVLEIGSGTGQHGAYFAPVLDHLQWQTSDFAHNHPSILAWIADNPVENLLPPIEFVIGVDDWTIEEVDGVFTANTAHIMQPGETRLMMETVAHVLPQGGVFCQYGPFNVEGQYTSESNRQFDRHLKQEGCGGIRDMQELQTWAKGLELVSREPMPANNFLLVWQKN